MANLITKFNEASQKDRELSADLAERRWMEEAIDDFINYLYAEQREDEKTAKYVAKKDEDFQWRMSYVYKAEIEQFGMDYTKELKQKAKQDKFKERFWRWLHTPQAQKLVTQERSTNVAKKYERWLKSEEGQKLIKTLKEEGKDALVEANTDLILRFLYSEVDEVDTDSTTL